MVASAPTTIPAWLKVAIDERAHGQNRGWARLAFDHFVAGGAGRGWTGNRTTRAFAGKPRCRSGAYGEQDCQADYRTSFSIVSNSYRLTASLNVRLAGYAGSLNRGTEVWLPTALRHVRDYLARDVDPK